MKEVLFVSDFNKKEPIIEQLNEHMKISPNMAEKLIGESALITWWYLKVFVDAGVITSESETNNLMYVLCLEYQR